MQTNSNAIKGIIVAILAFMLGFAVCYTFWPRTVTVVEYKDKVIQGAAKTITNTEIVYVPKVVDSSGQQEKTDLQVDIAKTDLNVKINGKDAVISKADDEQYLFEKNKIALQQSSKAEVNINVPVIDNTKYWGLGVGYGKNGVAGTVDFPINRKSAVGGWFYGDKVTAAAGVKFRF